MRTPLDLALSLVTQVDPNLGTKEAQQGAIQRMADPQAYDLVFPVIAFILVIMVPAVTGLWVIFKTATEKTKEADET
jgi:putative exporter of polyketide antibiotics